MTGQFTTMLVFAIVTLPSASAAWTSSPDLSTEGGTPDFQVTVFDLQQRGVAGICATIGPSWERSGRDHIGLLEVGDNIGSEKIISCSPVKWKMSSALDMGQRHVW